jgi:glycosyltransferase involved in cell wall biosynthesis
MDSEPGIKKETMNILLFHLVDFPNGAAGSAHARLIIKGFRRLGISAFLIIPHGQSIGNHEGNIRLKGRLEGVPFFYLNGTTSRPGNQIIRFIQDYIGMVKGARLLVKRRKRRRLDAVIIGTPDFIRYFPVIFTCILFKIPMFIWAVEKMTLKKDQIDIKHRIRCLGYSLSERVLPRFASGYMVISTLLLNYYRKYLSPEKIMLWPILVDPDVDLSKKKLTAAPPLKNKYRGKRLIVYSGSFGEKDGIFFLLTAFSRFLRESPSAHLIMTGKGSLNNMKKAHRYISDLNLNDKVELVGFLDRNELTSYYLIAHLFLVCRSNSSYAQHGLAWKLGEYAMTAKPVLATKVGDIELYFKNGEDIFLTEPENVAAIATQLTLIFKDYNHALNVAQNGKQSAVKHFDYITQSQRAINFIERNIIQRTKDGVGSSRLKN